MNDHLSGSPTLAAALLALALILTGIGPAQARQDCQPDPNGQHCVAQVDFAAFTQSAYQSQRQSEWCWAACIAMLFSYYDHPVDQSRVVQEAYGGTDNLPARGTTISSELDREWQDDNGDVFNSRLTGLLDVEAGLTAIDNWQIVSELADGNPLIVGAGGHAMVLTMLEYYATPSGLVPVAAGVFDPWPGRGARLLAQQEFVPETLGGSLSYLAAVRVEDVWQVGGGDSDSRNPGGDQPAEPRASDSLSGDANSSQTTDEPADMGCSTTTPGRSAPISACLSLLAGLVGCRFRRRFDSAPSRRAP